MQGSYEYILTSSDKLMAFNDKFTIWRTQVEQKKNTDFP